MTMQKKASSPTKDALKLLFRNPSAVIALLLILALAAAAITGKTLTGKQPTPDQVESMEEAEVLGDTLDLDVNEWAVVDPSETNLKDKLKPPFSASEEVEGRTYVLGTDHLGHNVLAQLWAGSSISLTIGFLAVGISVLLGVILGGIAGFFGRDRVRLPLLITLLFALSGGIAIPAEAVTVGIVLFIIAGVVFVYQIAVAAIGKRWRALAGFGVAALIAGCVFGYNSYIEHATPEGKRLQHAGEVASVAKDVLLLTRDLGRDFKDYENGLPGAATEEELWEMQAELEVAYYEMYLAEKRLQNNDYLTGLEVNERRAEESIERADLLDGHIEESYLEGEISEDDEEQAKLQKRHRRWQAKSEEHRKSGERGRLRAERVSAQMEAVNEWVDEAILAAEETIDGMEKYDPQSAEDRFTMMRELRLAMLEIDYRFAVRGVIENLAASGAEPELPEAEDRNKAAEALKKQADERVATLQKELEGAEEDAAETLQQDLAEAQAGAAAVEGVKAAAKGIETASERADELMEIVKADFYSGNREKLATLATQLRDYIDEGVPAGRRDLLTEVAGSIDGVIKEGIWKQDKAPLTGASAELKQAVNPPEGQTAPTDEQLKVKLERISKLLIAASHDRLEEYDYAIENVAARDPLVMTFEGSNKLLNRRAQMRGDYLKKYETEAASLFDGTSGIVKIRELDGTLRYGLYKWTRHFLVITSVILLLVVTALMLAGSAQSAADDMGGPLAKAFIPTINVDDLVMRFTEIMMTIPVIFLILAVLALFERDVYIVMGVIGLTSWMGTTRFVRAEILSLREQDFIQAARALGVRDYRIIWRHLVPNAISPVLVSATLGVASAVLAESTLSFLGIGAGPDQHTWGQILSKGREYIQDAPWLTIVPGIAILITVLSFNLLGEGLREAFNPKLRGR